MRMIGASNVSPTERAKLYRSGGVLWITARTAVLDMLSAHLPPHLVQGIVVLRCEHMRDTSTDAFAVRECRRHNSLAFVKGLTDRVESVVTGFASAEKTMRLLRVRHLFVWPRFRDIVKNDLESRPPEVVVCSQPMTESMVLIQTHLLAIITLCVSEVKRANLQSDVREQFTLDRVLTRQFEQTVAQSITPKWYSIGARTKQLISDIRALRRLLFALVQSDAVNFYRYWQLCLEQQSQWIFTDDAQKLDRLARERVFVAPAAVDPALIDLSLVDEPAAAGASKRRRTESGAEPSAVQLILEEPPKWQQLNELLAEIADTDRLAGLSGSTTLIVAADARGAAQVRDYLTRGARAALRESFATYQRYRRMRAAQAAQPNTEKVGQFERYRRAQGGRRVFAQAEVTAQMAETADKDDNGGERPDDVDNNAVDDEPLDLLTQADQQADWLSSQAPPTMVVEAETVAASTAATTATTTAISEGEQVVNFDANFGVLSAPMVLITSVDEPAALVNYRPRYVILLQPDVSYVRELERFKASRPGATLRVYYCIYTDSVEQAHNECLLKAEMESFRALVSIKAKLVLPESFDEPVIDDAELEVLPANPFSVGDARAPSKTSALIGGRSVVPQADLVLVDAREFRSSLPSMLHRDRLRLLPTTLAVGDYILAPDVCVERKSVADLVGSLNSGHLFEQASALCRLYERPVLLIEFDEHEAFGLAPPELLNSEISGANVQSKLTLLTLHFPRLCVMMSRSSRDTAKLFRQLKRNRPDPDVRVVANAAAEATVASETEDLIRALPGVTNRNYAVIVQQCRTLAELFSKSRLQLEAMLGAQSGAALHEFINKRQTIAKKIQ
jgi:DNA excision repair protein ERCC-4